jgi:hypothetical protein
MTARVIVFPLGPILDADRVPRDEPAEILVLPVVRVERPSVPEARRRRGKRSLLPPVIPQVQP